MAMSIDKEPGNVGDRNIFKRLGHVDNNNISFSQPIICVYIRLNTLRVQPDSPTPTIQEELRLFGSFSLEKYRKDEEKRVKRGGRASLNTARLKRPLPLERV